MQLRPQRTFGTTLHSAPLANTTITLDELLLLSPERPIQSLAAKSIFRAFHPRIFTSTKKITPLSFGILSHYDRVARPSIKFHSTMRTPASRLSSAPKKGPSCGPRKSTTDPTRRVEFTDTSVSIFGWPSRGGVIILSDATHVDFAFLGLSTTNPSLTRRSRSTATASRGDDKNQHNSGTASSADDTGGSQPAEGEEEEEQGDEDEEDAFCQCLLLLGAKWWDNEKRYQFIDHFAAGIQPFVEDVEEGRVAEPTLRERRWMKVGWEQAAANSSAGGGGFWILDCDTNWMGIIEEDNLVPADAAKVRLAKTMEERCEILKGMGARFYAGLEDYESESTFLRAWEWKWEGEIGHLKKVDS